MQAAESRDTLMLEGEGGFRLPAAFWEEEITQFVSVHLL